MICVLITNGLNSWISFLFPLLKKPKKPKQGLTNHYKSESVQTGFCEFCTLVDVASKFIVKNNSNQETKQET